MMNQKFSQLNRDYAKAMAGRDSATVKHATHRFFLGLCLSFLLLLIVIGLFYLVKKPFAKQVQQLSKTPTIVENPKPAPKKKVKTKLSSHTKQDYGFYTMLPEMEVKSAHHEEEAPVSNE